MKYTKLERNWVMYDVGNSALVLLNTSVVPIYFNAINTGASSADLVVAWGNAQTIASLVIAMLMPILGALADYTGKTPNVTFNYNAHQHTSKGSVPGITGNVDLNVTTLNYPKIIRKKGLTRLREGA